MKHYSPTGRRNRGRPLKRLLDTWGRNGSTSGLTPWQTYDDDDIILLLHFNRSLLWRLSSGTATRTYVFTYQIWILSKDFRRSPQYQIQG
jgi:hypothetical protein